MTGAGQRKAGLRPERDASQEGMTYSAPPPMYHLSRSGVPGDPSASPVSSCGPHLGFGKATAAGNGDKQELGGSAWTLSRAAGCTHRGSRCPPSIIAGRVRIMRRGCRHDILAREPSHHLCDHIILVTSSRRRLPVRCDNTSGGDANGKRIPKRSMNKSRNDSPANPV